MCVIACYEDNYPNASDLIDMESMNQDGAGIAWIEGGFVHWKKGLTAKEIITMIKMGQVKLPLIVHFRITSVGEKNKYLTHPFQCLEKAKLKLEGKSKSPILFHNGTWTEYKEHLLKSIHAQGGKIPDGLISDSRIMAWLIARHGINYSLFFENQKIAIMTPQGIKRFGNWFDCINEKTIASNTYWKQSNQDMWGGYSFQDMQKMSQGKDVERKDYKPQLTHKMNTGTKHTSYTKPNIETKKSQKRLEAIEKKIIEDSGIEALSKKEIDFLVDILPQEYDDQTKADSLRNLLIENPMYVIEQYYINNKNLYDTMFDIYGIDVREEIKKNSEEVLKTKPAYDKGLDIWGFKKQ